jgi:hypothetical protein
MPRPYEQHPETLTEQHTIANHQCPTAELLQAFDPKMWLCMQMLMGPTCPFDCNHWQHSAETVLGGMGTIQAMTAIPRTLTYTREHNAIQRTTD